MAFLDETGLAELWSLVRNADVKIATGNYTGTGTYGASKPNSLAFDFTPKVVFITIAGESASTPQIACYVYGMSKMSIVSSNSNWSTLATVSTSGNTMTWYAPANANQQMNNGEYTYHYVAIG